MGAETKEKRGIAAKGAEKGKRGGWRWEILEGLGGPAITSGGGRGGRGPRVRTQNSEADFCGIAIASDG
jgi:hypothetical protein